MTKNQIRAEICKSCQGKGITPGSNKVCEICRGVGFIGTDGTNEYFLADDGTGNLQIKGMIGQAQPQAETEKSPISYKTQRRNVLKMLILLLFVIFYLGFLTVYLTWIKEAKVFWVVTVITAGFFLSYILVNTKLVTIVPNLISRILIKEPNDFLSEVKRLRQGST